MLPGLQCKALIWELGMGWSLTGCGMGYSRLPEHPDLGINSTDIPHPRQHLLLGWLPTEQTGILQLPSPWKG